MHVNYKDKLKLVLLLVPGFAVRVALAPYTAGSDLAQFAGFADTMLRHGLQFFSYSDGLKAAEEGWPYGWPYVYGPLLVLMLAAIRLAVPSPIKTYWERGAYHVVVPNEWAAAVKSVFIAFDTLSAILVYKLALTTGASRRRALASAILYYYNPMTVYVSSIYGMFDQIPLSLALAGLYFYVKKRKGRGLFLLGLASSFKPTMVFVTLPVMVHALVTSGARSTTFKLLGFLVVGALAPFIPFIIADPGGITVYLKAVSIVSSPSYASNVQYSFNGFASIAFYAWWHGETDATKSILRLWPLFFTPLYALLIVHATRGRDPIKLASLGYIIYTATYWRVNPQYIAPLIAFILLVRDRSAENRVRALSGLAIIIASLWPLLYPISFWAWVHVEKPSSLVINILTKISLNITEALYYVYYSLALTVTLLLFILEELLMPTITRHHYRKMISILYKNIYSNHASKSIE